MPDPKSERIQLEVIQKVFLQKNYSEALSLAEKLLQDFPLSFQGKLFYAKVLRALGRLNDARNLLQELDKQYAYNIGVLGELAGVLFSQKEFQESLILYNRILFLDSFNNEAKQRVEEIQKMVDQNFEESLEETRIDPQNVSEKEEIREVEKKKETEAPKKINQEMQKRREIDPVVSLHLGDTGVFNPVVQDMETQKKPIQIKTEDEYLVVIEPLENSGAIIPEEPKARVEEMVSKMISEEIMALVEIDSPSDENRYEEKSGKDDIQFSTESAAELYISQGLYKDAKAIYKKLFDQTGDDRYMLKLAELNAIPAIPEEKQRIIDALERFLDRLKRREISHV